MRRLHINPGSEHPLRSAQSQYLAGLLLSEGLSAREVARRSAMIAELNGKPELAVGHQAVSAWVNGTRHPNAKHKTLLATILGVSVANLNHACDAEDDHLNVSILKLATVFVHGTLQNYRYSAAVRADINLAEPAIYRDWSDMFSFRPARLMRHLRNIHYHLFGWIPDNSASPMVRNPHCLVPLERVTQRTAVRMLDTAESAHRRVWFVYLPGGKLHLGIGYRDSRSFSFARNNGRGVVIENFPLSQVEFVGYFTGKVLFHLFLAPKSQESGH
jgi:transcriptional regulator with XRE-family HTH domain